MKKLYLVLSIFFFGILMVACSDDSATADPDEMVIIQVTNSSDEQITSIELKFYQNDMVQASPTAMNEDESLIVMGESVDFDILTQNLNFSEPVVIEAVAMIGGVEVSAGKTAPMELIQGDSYSFELARDPELQFREVLED